MPAGPVQLQIGNMHICSSSGSSDGNIYAVNKTRHSKAFIKTYLFMYTDLESQCS